MRFQLHERSLFESGLYWTEPKHLVSLVEWTSTIRTTGHRHYCSKIVLKVGRPVANVWRVL